VLIQSLRAAEAEDKVLVLGGIHVGAQLVRRGPELLFYVVEHCAVWQSRWQDWHYVSGTAGWKPEPEFHASRVQYRYYLA
jgi:hypothetical protein